MIDRAPIDVNPNTVDDELARERIASRERVRRMRDCERRRFDLCTLDGTRLAKPARRMSALPPKADIRADITFVRFVPQSEVANVIQ